MSLVSLISLLSLLSPLCLTLALRPFPPGAHVHRLASGHRPTNSPRTTINPSIKALQTSAISTIFTNFKIGSRVNRLRCLHRRHLHQRETRSPSTLAIIFSATSHSPLHPHPLLRMSHLWLSRLYPAISCHLLFSTINSSSNSVSM